MNSYALISMGTLNWGFLLLFQIKGCFGICESGKYCLEIY